ncbi:hypothetical protein ACSQ67_016989 [Phaseolus vulgaris]
MMLQFSPMQQKQISRVQQKQISRIGRGAADEGYVHSAHEGSFTLLMKGLFILQVKVLLGVVYQIQCSICSVSILLWFIGSVSITAACAVPDVVLVGSGVYEEEPYQSSIMYTLSLPRVNTTIISQIASTVCMENWISLFAFHIFNSQKP